MSPRYQLCSVGDSLMPHLVELGGALVALCRRGVAHSPHGPAMDSLRAGASAGLCLACRRTVGRSALAADARRLLVERRMDLDGIAVRLGVSRRTVQRLLGGGA